MSGSAAWPRVRLGDVLRHVARPLTVEVDGSYREIGIRSHGKGLFHKAPVTGAALGDKRVFHVEPGDFVLNIVFAWEGAVGLVSEAERGMIASHRFPCFRAVDGRVDLRFLERFFQTPAGLELLGRVSPGGAGRNRTLNRTSFMQQEITLPPLAEQQRIVERLTALSDEIAHALRHRQEVESLRDALLAAASNRLFASGGAHVPLRMLGDVRGGIQKSPQRAPGGNSVRYLTVAHVQRNEISTADPRHFEVTAAELERWRLQAGDVLIVEGNGSADQIGRTALFMGEIDDCVHQNHIIRVRPEPSAVLPEFLNAYLNSAPGREAVQAQARSTSGLRTLSVGRIREIAVPVFSLDEQRRLVSEWSAMQAAVATLERKQAAVRIELDALLPAILDRAFAGAL